MSGATAGYPGGYPRGPNPGISPGMGPGGQFSGHPEDTPARDPRYETPVFNHPGHPHPGFTGGSGPPPSGISAPPTSSYRRWTPGSTAGGPPGGPAPGYAQPGPGVPHPGPGGPSPSGPYPGGPAPPRGVPMRGPPLDSAPGSGYATGAVAGYGGGYVPGDTTRSSHPGMASSGISTAAPRRPPSAAPPVSYDVVHLSARNARLEEKLSKALAKNRSMAKYYDQLLAKTRDAQEREVEGLREEIARLNRRAADAADDGAPHNNVHNDVERRELREEQRKRVALERQLETMRAENDGRSGSNKEAFAETSAALRVATDALALRDAELATLRAKIAESSLVSSDHALSGVSNDNGLNSSNSTLTQMRELLDRAKEDAARERKDAERRDAEMARQLTEIKEQALERIRESTAAAREVATLKERCHASELERDRLRDKVQELEHDERDHRELRRMARDAEHAAKSMREKADRCELAEARLRQEQAHVASLRDERAQAHARTQEMTERLLNIQNEKDVLVRHSARQVHVEAELAVAKEELERLKKQSLATRAEAKETTSVWRDGAEGLGRVLRAHIYGHARWERAVSDECSGALDAHEHAQRSTVRLVAAAEQEAAGLAGEAVEVVRATRQLLGEYALESKAVISEIRETAQRNADERVEAALSMLREAETRAEAAEADSAAAQADARRARAAAARAGVLPTALAVPDADASQVSDLLSRSSTTNPAFRRALRERQFQMFGVAMWKRAAAREGTRDVAFLRGQLELARRETKVALAQAERSERLSDQRGVSTKWGILCAGALRAHDKEQRARAEDVELALETASRKLHASVAERDAATEALRRADTEIARLVRALDALRVDHDDALRRLQNERGLRGELGMLARGRNPGGDERDADDAFLDEPSIAATRKAMDALHDATTHAVALARTAAEDARMGTDASVARDQLEDTLRACHDALLIMADEEENKKRIEKAERERVAVGLGPSPPPSATGQSTNRELDAQRAASSMDAATRRVQRRALEVKAELVAALLDGLAARRDAIVAERNAGASAEKVSKYRAENAAERMMRFARVSKERRVLEGSLPGTPEEITAHAAQTERVPSSETTEQRKGASDRFGSAASGYARAARAATTWSARAISARDRDPDPDPGKGDGSGSVASGSDADTPPSAEVFSEREDPRSVRSSVAAGADAFSDPDQFSSAQAARRARPKVVHSPPAKAHALRAREAVVARGGGVSFDEDPAERSYASLVKARARRAEALAARSANDGTLEEMRAATGGDERERAGTAAGKPATKQKKWTPPPWDERPLRKSDKKSQGVTNPYAAKLAKARVARR